MSYSEFVDKYPWFSLFWEIFKGVIPTVIAIVTIAVNNKIAKQRQKKSEHKEVLKKLQKDAYTILTMIREQGTYFIDYFQNSKGNNLSITDFEKYYEINKKILIKSREVMFQSKVFCRIYDNRIYDFENCMCFISEYANEMNHKLASYECKFHRISSEVEKEMLYDEIQKDMIEMTSIAETQLFEYCVRISKGKMREKSKANGNATILKKINLGAQVTALVTVVALIIVLSVYCRLIGINVGIAIMSFMLFLYTGMRIIVEKIEQKGKKGYAPYVLLNVLILLMLIVPWLLIRFIPTEQFNVVCDWISLITLIISLFIEAIYIIVGFFGDYLSRKKCKDSETDSPDSIVGMRT